MKKTENKTQTHTNKNGNIHIQEQQRKNKRITAEKQEILIYILNNTTIKMQGM